MKSNIFSQFFHLMLVYLSMEKVALVDNNLNSNTTKKSLKKNKKYIRFFSYVSVAFLSFGIGVLLTSIYSYYISSSVSTAVNIENTPDTGEEELIYSDEPITSPLNGIEISEVDYENLVKNIPHAVMISNNKSARVEQYGLNYADIVYEAQVEGGITRFMGIYWSNQKDFIVKPVRSVRKYFLDWLVEYGNIPISFTGFATTDNPDTDAFGFSKEQGIRTTYWYWPFKWDDECIAVHPRMHCKRVHPEDLYTLFDNLGWTYESWNGFIGEHEWSFSETLEDIGEYSDAFEFQYDFAGYNDWSSRWVYNEDEGVYEKHDPITLHKDMNDQEIIKASTVIIQKVDRFYTYDSEDRVTYETIGEGDAYIMRDGKVIEAKWIKEFYKYRTRYFHVKHFPFYKYEINLKPGLIWIAIVPSDKDISIQ